MTRRTIVTIRVDDVRTLELGLTQNEIEVAFRYLKDRRLIQTFSLPYAASVSNADGTDAVESHARSPSTRPEMTAIDPSRGIVAVATAVPSPPSLAAPAPPVLRIEKTVFISYRRTAGFRGQ